MLSNGTEKRGVLNLVDLAGSEKVGKSGAQGQLFQEGTKINLSLSALGNVIHALTSNLDHIPYRDSKLTRLLQESLGGNYKTTLIVTCSPHSSAMQESLSTLKFAQRAKKLRNRVKMNIKNSPKQLLKIIDQLRENLRAKEEEIHRLSSFEGFKAYNSINIVNKEDEPSGKSAVTETSQKQIPRSKSAKRFGMNVYITGGTESGERNQIVVNVNNAKGHENDTETWETKCKEKEREAKTWRSKSEELMVCVEGLRKENYELNLKLRGMELDMIEEKKRVFVAENRVTECESLLASSQEKSAICGLKKESEGIQLQILSNQNKALTEALEDAEAECFKLMKEKKDKIEKETVEMFSLNLTDYFHKHTIQTSV